MWLRDRADSVKLEQITGIKVNATEAHALDVIQAVRKQVYEDRTATNGAAKAKRSTIIQLQAAIPEDFEEPQFDEDALNNELAQIEKNRDERLSAIDVKITRIRNEAQAEIDALMEQLNAKKAFLTEQNSKATIAANEAKSAAEQQKVKVQNDLRSLRQNQENVVRAKQTRENIVKLEKDAMDLESQAEGMTAIIDKLDAYKAQLLSNLPIPGLEVSNGEVLYKGVSFDRVNTAQKVKIAVELAKLRAGKLGLVCVDGIEALDQGMYEAFRAEAIKSGVQMVVTRVTDNDFAVEVDE